MSKVEFNCHRVVLEKRVRVAKGVTGLGFHSPIPQVLSQMQGMFVVVGSLESISPTFHEELFCQNSFDKKFQNKTVIRDKLCKKTFVQKSCL